VLLPVAPTISTPPHSPLSAQPRILQDSPEVEGSGNPEFAGTPAESDMASETYAQAMLTLASGEHGAQQTPFSMPDTLVVSSSQPDTTSPPPSPPSSPLESPAATPSWPETPPHVAVDNLPPALQQSPSSSPQTYLEELCSKTDSSADAVFKCVNAVRTNPQAWNGQYPCDTSGWISAVSNPPRPPFKRNNQLDGSAWRQASDMAK